MFSTFLAFFFRIFIFFSPTNFRTIFSFSAVCSVCAGCLLRMYFTDPFFPLLEKIVYPESSVVKNLIFKSWYGENKKMNFRKTSSSWYTLLASDEAVRYDMQKPAAKLCNAARSRFDAFEQVPPTAFKTNSPRLECITGFFTYPHKKWVDMYIFMLSKISYQFI